MTTTFDLVSPDFLTITRNNEWHLDAFTVPNELYNVQVWDTGVIYFSPKNSERNDKVNTETKTEKAFVFSSAIHGNETAPIEICTDIINGLVSNTLTIKHPVLFIYGNPAAINIGERFVDENLNRLFSGRHTKIDETTKQALSFENKECERAAKLEEYVTRFFELHPEAERTHYDLHTAIRDSAHEKFAVYPFIHGKPWKKQQFEILRAMGVTTFLLMEKPATTFSYYSSKQHNANSFTVELGKVRPFGENDQSKFAAAKETLINLLQGQLFDGEAFDAANYQIMTVYREINKTDDSFELSFADNVANFTEFAKGDELAKEQGKPILAIEEGEAIVFPNAHVAIGQRALLTVLPTDISDNLV
ncbi:succinylglutamate desuccinylase [Psychrosphaera sp.]|nr:succinylglutamate desuccinylase [Psychrosphaera sp.]